MFAKILVPVDLEHRASNDEILRVATTIANDEGARLVLMTVVEPTPVAVSPYLPKRFQTQLTEDTANDLKQLAGSLSVSNGTVDSTVRFGSVYKEIIAYAERIGADLLVMGSHKPNVSDFLLGSNASRVVRHSNCSVYIVRIPDGS